MECFGHSQNCTVRALNVVNEMNYVIIKDYPEIIMYEKLVSYLIKDAKLITSQK